MSCSLVVTRLLASGSKMLESLYYITGAAGNRAAITGTGLVIAEWAVSSFIRSAG